MSRGRQRAFGRRRFDDDLAIAQSPDEQCPYVKPNGSFDDEGVLCCSLLVGHDIATDPHEDAYGSQDGYWHLPCSD